MKTIKVPVTKDFSKVTEDIIGTLNIVEDEIFFNPDYCFEPGLVKDEYGNWILKEISLVKRKQQ